MKIIARLLISFSIIDPITHNLLLIGNSPKLKSLKYLKQELLTISC